MKLTTAPTKPSSPLRSGAIYTGSLFLQRAISIVLLPLYINILGPEGFGQIALIMSISGAAVALLAFGLEAAIFRTYFQLEASPDERNRFLSTVGLFLFITPAVMVGIVLAGTLLYAPMSRDLLALGLMAAALQTSATVFPFAVLRAEERPGAYALLNLQYSAVLAALVVALVVIFDGGTTGWLVANLIAWASVLPQAIAVLRRHWSRHIDPRYVLAALAFGLPLVPHVFAHWGLNLSDRLVLSAWVSDAQIGIYGFGYQAAALMGMILTGVQWALIPRYGRSIQDASTSFKSLQPIIMNQVLFTLALTAVWVVLIPPALEAIMPASFDEAAGIVPWVSVGYCFYGLYFIPMNLVSVVIGETRWIWTATGAAAAVNVGFNLAFVPRYGIEAAAVGTAAGYAVLLLATTGYLLYAVRSRVHRVLSPALERLS